MTGYLGGQEFDRLLWRRRPAKPSPASSQAAAEIGGGGGRDLPGEAFRAGRYDRSLLHGALEAGAPQALREVHHPAAAGGVAVGDGEGEALPDCCGSVLPLRRGGPMPRCALRPEPGLGRLRRRHVVGHGGGSLVVAEPAGAVVVVVGRGAGGVGRRRRQAGARGAHLQRPSSRRRRRGWGVVELLLLRGR